MTVTMISTSLFSGTVVVGVMTVMTVPLGASSGILSQPEEADMSPIADRNPKVRADSAAAACVLCYHN